jgi:hypothetical protein
MNGVSISFFKTNFPRRWMKDVARGQLWFSFEELSWVNYSGWFIGSGQWKRKCQHFSAQWTTCVSPVRCLFFFFVFLLENTLLWFFKWKDYLPQLVLDFMAECVCLWNTKSEHCRNKPARENILQEIVQELNFPELTAKKVKLKIKTFRTRCAAELIKSQKLVAADMKFLCRNVFGSAKHIYFCVAFIFHKPQCQQKIFLQHFIPAWHLYSTNLSVNKSSSFDIFSTFVY